MIWSRTRNSLSRWSSSTGLTIMSCQTTLEFTLNITTGKVMLKKSKTIAKEIIFRYSPIMSVEAQIREITPTLGEMKTKR